MTHARMPLARKRWLRRVAAQIFGRVNLGDVTIQHPFTGTRFYLHSFRHKGYWFYGRRREAEAMAFLRELIQPGLTVIDVGAHIGFVTLFLEQCVGSSGRVYAFEPGANNLSYLRRNCGSYPNIHVEPCAVGDSAGMREFYLEDLSGQNNSFVNAYEGLRAHERALGMHAHVEKTMVPVVTLDAFCKERGIAPALIKIDAEGAEWEILRGAACTLEQYHPHLLVEMNTHQAEMFAFLQARGYEFFDEGRKRLRSAEGVHFNVFCLWGRS
ncbi:MAG TPA: FkbM family methyltransferase [Anaerolineae bacterium]|nr:FkbM family methyltransferase [Anaerolineae bacterium]